ncbi:type I DNA topoisomerase [candidate division CSSED10-310 bacterium]|uniref:DNA topoisomerase 1 n=1 Tax=candidate division CSSED10-310 bacterium TaxID=2855610 RepID=A0ABV6YVE6_UNCC1
MGSSKAVKNLVIVESPAKAETISKYLGQDYVVKASYGHVRDLPKTKLGVDIKNNFKPQYLTTSNKYTSRAINEIKSLYNKNKTALFLATDEDREGEAIGWHLVEILKPVRSDTIKRIVFHEITKEAITKALKNPRVINNDLVDAQQARRVLDRLVGYELSPILWKTVRSGLSAGRVQSVALRFIVERERAIENFISAGSYRINGEFRTKKGNTLGAELNKKFTQEKDVHSFLEKCRQAQFTVEKVEKKKARKSPPPPFTTSTLQQEAARKLSYSVKRTMVVAQKLYETGKITYMRTDSVHLSDFALKEANSVICSKYGQKYAQTRQFKTKTALAQEAHEAIRPTDFKVMKAGLSRQEERLYELIWQRALASQMCDAMFDKTTATIGISTTPEKFVARGQILTFDGYLKVYIEGKDNGNSDENGAQLPPINSGDPLFRLRIVAHEKFSRPPYRFSEASLVKKLEEMGIGRPSTYAPTLSTILERGYVALEDRPGTKRKVKIIILENDEITAQDKTEVTGAEKAKLIPTSIGAVVNDFLVKHFSDIVDYQFTARIEKEFDDIAAGKKKWNTIIANFYDTFHKTVVDKRNSVTRKDTLPLRELGNDPLTGKQVSARLGPYGPYVQLGSPDGKEKPKFTSLLPGQKIETITLQEALDLFKLPRVLGKDETGKTILANIGPFGPYVKADKSFASISAEELFNITLEQALVKLEQKKSVNQNKIIKEFDEDPIKILKGRWGPYISNGEINRRIPKTIEDPARLTLQDCKELLAKPVRKRRKKAT